MTIDIQGGEGSHLCTSHREGDWAVWRCPICPGYERRLNLVTGKMAFKNKSGIPHTGSTGDSPSESINQPLAQHLCEN